MAPIPGAVDQSWPPTDEPLSIAQRVEMQRLLSALGYSVGPADGNPGAQTRSAIRDYQATTRRRADGVLSTELLASLRADGQRNGIRLAVPTTAPEPNAPLAPAATVRPPLDTAPARRRLPGGRPDNPPEPVRIAAPPPTASVDRAPQTAPVTQASAPDAVATPNSVAPTDAPPAAPPAAPATAPAASPDRARDRPVETPEPTFVRRRVPTDTDTDSGGWN
ncbi:MAG: peptidoglycan-binding protein [Pseudomonadota bacterium]